MDGWRRVTSFDVAEAAGVSQSTVSRALSGATTVTPETRARVETAARNLGYVVNQKAAQLRRGTSATLAVVLVTHDQAVPEQINPFAQTLLASICSAAAAQGYAVLVSIQDGGQASGVDYLARGQADGMIVIGSRRNTAAWGDMSRLAAEDPRVVFWGGMQAGLTSVGWDNHAGAATAAEHLLSAGYRSIACITAVEDTYPHFGERAAGLHNALAKGGMQPVVIAVEPDGDRAEQGRRAVRRLLDERREFDALFCVCDAMALGALQELHGAGVSVPGQVGVIGFDGLQAGEFSCPSLTTIAPDYSLAGRMLVDAALRSNAAAGFASVPVKLITRGSTRMVPGSA